MDEHLGELVMTTDVVGVPVGRHRGDRTTEQVGRRLDEARDAHPRVDHEITITTPDVPDVAAHQRHDVRFPQQRDGVVDVRSFEPRVGDRQRVRHGRCRAE